MVDVMQKGTLVHGQKAIEPDLQRYERGPTVADLLRGYLHHKACSYSTVAANSGVDVAYVFRLCNGHKTNPSRDVIIRIGGWGLRLAPYEIDELLLAAGFAPLFYDR
jgi:hypothetical protein